MSNKQSSVEWYAKQIDILHYDYFTESLSKEEKNVRLKQLLEQAKAMHQEEITDAYIECWMNDGGNGFHKVKEAEQYYNEHYGE